MLRRVSGVVATLLAVLPVGGAAYVPSAPAAGPSAPVGAGPAFPEQAAVFVICFVVVGLIARLASARRRRAVGELA